MSIVTAPKIKPLDALKPLVVLTTGGTIDKAYFDASSEYRIGESMVTRLLTIANVDCPYKIVEFSRKDSLDMTDQDRDALRTRVKSMFASRIVITHGTDTMAETARRLVGATRKTIVLTGAMSPARFSESDAAFNLGMAFAIAQTATPGVYITMNGQVFRGDRVRKDRQNRRFVHDAQGSVARVE